MIDLQIASPKTRDRNAPIRMTTAFLTRVGGLPFDVADGLASPRSTVAATVVFERKRLVNATAALLSDAIAAAIGGLEDRPLRGALIRARRDIHNGREPREADATVLNASKGGLGALYGEWTELRASVGQAQRDAESAAVADQTEARALLKRLANDEEFLKAIMLASPSLLEQLRRSPLSLDTPSSNKKQRAVERALTRYALRASTKTSPFSSLTSVVRSTLTRDPDAGALQFQATHSDVERHARLNVAVLARISELIKSSADLAPDLPVRIVSEIAQDSRRVRYMRRQRNRGDDSAVVTLDAMQENLFYLASGRHLARVIELARDSVTIGELERALTAEQPAPDDADLVVRFVRHLVRLGLLEVPALAVPIHAPDPVRSFASSLRTLGVDWATALSTKLDDIAGLVQGFATQNVAARGRTIGSIRADLSEILVSLGADGETVSNLIYEDATLTGATVRGDAEVWESDFAPQLARVTSVLPVFDGLLSHQILLKDFFRLRFGVGGHCDDVLRFAHDFHLDIYDEFVRTGADTPLPEADGTVADRTNWLDSNQIRGLDVARRRLVAGMRQRYEEQGTPTDRIELDDGFFDEVASELPDLGERIDPRSYFLQVSNGDRERLILNKSYTGLGLLFSRFSYCFDNDEVPLNEQVATALLAASPDGAVFAEMSGGVDTSNLNLHGITTEYQLVCPGDPGILTSEKQIAVDDLTIRHNARTDRLELHSERLLRVVIPVYHGFLLPLALPDLQRVLLLFSYTRLAQLDLWSGTDQPLGEREVSSHPRVVYGDIVLVRKTWKANPARLPRRNSYASEPEWFQAWQEWAHQHGLPRRIFASLPVGGDDRTSADGAPEGPGAAFGAGKPQYVDFQSFHCLALLEDMLEDGPGRIVFVEMLPDSGSLWLDAAGQRFVAEQTMESVQLSLGDDS